MIIIYMKEYNEVTINPINLKLPPTDIRINTELNCKIIFKIYGD